MHSQQPREPKDPRYSHRRLDAVLKFKSFRAKTIAAPASTPSLVTRQVEFKKQPAFPVFKSKSQHRYTGCRLPLVEKTHNNQDFTLAVVPCHSQSEEKLSSIEEKGLRTIGEVRPKINKIKFSHLRSSFKTEDKDGRWDENYQRFRRMIQQRLRKSHQRVKINLSCQSIAPLSLGDQDEHVIGQSSYESRRGSGIKKSASQRYKQIPPEQFLYERESVQLGKGMVARLTKMMGKPSTDIFTKYN